MTRIIMLAALAATPFFALAVSPAPAHSQHIQAYSQVVSYGDLDLSDEAGVRALDRRIRTAIHTVCGVPSDADPAGKNDIRRCQIETAGRIAALRNLAIAEARQPVRTASKD